MADKKKIDKEEEKKEEKTKKGATRGDPIASIEY